jgi:hypothetical protein
MCPSHTYANCKSLLTNPWRLHTGMLNFTHITISFYRSQKSLNQMLDEKVYIVWNMILWWPRVVGTINVCMTIKNYVVFDETYRITNKITTCYLHKCEPKKISTGVDLWNIKLEMRLLKLRCTKKLACICCMGACSENKRENYYQDTNMVLNMPYS